MYLDPGFGGMLLQVIVAIVAVGGAILYSFRKKIRTHLMKKDSNDENISISSSETLHTDDDAIDTLVVEKETE